MLIIRKACAPGNFRAGRQGHAVEGIVIHIIDGSQASCDATFASSSLELKRSAHYSIGRDGEIHQYVDENDTAFHAGRIQQPTWIGMKKRGDGSFVNPNLYTIGIEHEGRAHDEWPDEMYDVTAGLMAAIAARHPTLATPFSAANVGMHREIFSGKSCPGFSFQLATLLGRIPSNPPAPAAPDTSLPALVTIERPVRVRTGGANTTAPIKTILPAGRQFAPVSVTIGQVVEGNSRWYEVAAQEFVWAGATDHP